MADEKLIEPYKRNYRVRSFAQSDASATILFVALAADNGTLQLPSAFRTFEMLRTLERACSDLRIRFSIVPYFEDYEGTVSFEPFVRTVRQQARTESVIGAVYCPYFWGRSEPIVGILEQAGIRTAVVDQVGTTDIDMAKTRNVAMRMFSLCHDTQSGKNIGQHLMALGHRAAAYVTAYPDDWSVHRFEGLREVMQAAGGTIQLFHKPVSIIGRNIDELLPAMGRILAAAVSEKLSRPPPSGPFRMNSDRLSSILYTEWASRQVIDLFSQPLSHPEITAWVADNDETALTMLEFLRDKGISVPHNLSVAGFDNIIEAEMAGLTSYDFNMTAVAHAALSFILNPPPQQRKKQPLIREIIEGLVIPRQTTSKAKSS